MSPVTGTIETPRSTDWQPSLASARRAADRAIHAAAVASAWAERVGAGRAEAAEAVAASARANAAAERAALATSREEVRELSRLAEDAARLALEADRRVSAAIAAELWASEDRRHQASLPSAA